ncbi:hypothetical protein G647_03607 [Cladophialophora carrionii CBS 160.54]|uniref:Metallo-beta-lactamase domain-containing protein n=1 Tax=Cladophialophora carrionii CBS 160.54 TaxID=1279043 RepID=V9DD42_9EURO|nr:uncharacterized protein G647_03607 [Cladophialophora carrionii CBS 160.54]ETI24238.1 hypothetical protein G647_03607 [Cladophialophora carrionii CBS 160.54]
MNTLQPRVTTLRSIADLVLASTSTTPSHALQFARSSRPLYPWQPKCRTTAAYSTQASPRQLLVATTTSAGRPQVTRLSSASTKGTSSRYSHNATTPRASHSVASPVIHEPVVHDVFEETTGTWQYVVADPATLTAVIIDPVLDYSPTTHTVSTEAADSLLSLIMFWGYKVDMILETHAHADHLTAASYLQHRLALQQGHRPLIGIGKRIGQVQRLFGERYGIPKDEYEDVFDKLFDDDETFAIGGLEAKATHLPGHTPDHLGYKIGNNVFCGDSIFHADIGTARCDFPGGSSTDLFASGRKLLALPDEVKIWTGHDYPPEGRDAPVPWMTVRQHKQRNKHLREGVTEQEFVALRDERDAKLGEPRLLHQSLQMNIRAGRLPKPTTSGPAMLHLPLKVRGLRW